MAAVNCQVISSTAPRHPIVPTTSTRIGGISTTTNSQKTSSTATPSTSARIADKPTATTLLATSSIVTPSTSARIAYKSTATTLSLKTSSIVTPSTSSQVYLVVPTHVIQPPDASNIQTSFPTSKTLAPTPEVTLSSMLEPMQTAVVPPEGGIDVSYTHCSTQP